MDGPAEETGPRDRVEGLIISQDINLSLYAGDGSGGAMTGEMMEINNPIVDCLFGFAILLKKQKQLWSAPHGLSPISRTAWVAPLAEGPSRRATRKVQGPALTQSLPRAWLGALTGQ